MLAQRNLKFSTCLALDSQMHLENHLPPHLPSKRQSEELTFIYA